MDCTCTYLFESPDSEVSPSDEVSPNREAIWLSLITPFVIMRRWKVVILLRDVYQYSYQIDNFQFIHSLLPSSGQTLALAEPEARLYNHTNPEAVCSVDNIYISDIYISDFQAAKAS